MSDEHIFAFELRPKCGKELPRYNFFQREANKIKLSDKDVDELNGICQLGAEQVQECYSLWDEIYNPFDIVSMCSKCNYCLKEISCKSILEFSKNTKTNGGVYQYPEFIQREFSKLICQENPTAFVYFVTDGNLVKIGKANGTNISRRKIQLQTGNSQKIFYIALIPCASPSDSYELEYKLHKIYSNFTISGEWFDLKNYIDIEEFHKTWNPARYIDEPQIHVWDYCKK